jgi:hypothetical protein
MLDRHGSITGSHRLGKSTTKRAANPHPHPTVILTNRLIRHHELEDPTINLSRQITLSNIAYLHAVHNHVVVGVVGRRYPVLHSNATPIMHAILAKSNYNHNKQPNNTTRTKKNNRETTECPSPYP